MAGRGEPAGILFILLSATAFGMTPTAAKLAYQAGATAPTLAAGRCLLGAVGLLALARLRGEHPRALAGRGGLVLAAGAFLYGGQAAMLFEALTLLPAATVTLLIYSYPAMVAVIARLAGAERLDVTKGGALVLGMAGVTLVVAAPAGGLDPVGTLLSLGSALAYAAYVVLAQRFGRLPPLTTGAAVLGGAGVTLLAWALASGGLRLDMPAAAWAWVGVHGLILQAVSVTAYLAAIARIGPTRSAIGDTFQPVVSVGLAAVVLGERLAALQWLGGLLVVGAVLVLVAWSRRAREVELGV